jgi:hypothetical protein
VSPIFPVAQESKKSKPFSSQEKNATRHTTDNNAAFFISTLLWVEDERPTSPRLRWVDVVRRVFGENCDLKANTLAAPISLGKNKSRMLAEKLSGVCQTIPTKLQKNSYKDPME